jgi:glycerophosphoryl diester phosphodiesterase
VPRGRPIGALAVGCVVVVVAAIAVARTVGGDGSGPSDQPRSSAADQPSADGPNPFRTGRILVIPHGGGDGLFPENTLLAFDRTMAMGADVVDVDLRITGDGVVIAFHDSTVDRVTGATGTVNEMTYGQLAALDAGWGYTSTDSDASGAHPYRGQGVVIPTFESILDRFPTTLLSLDLKDESLDMVQPVCDLLRSHHRLNDVFVGSNSDPQILEFRAQCPDVRTSAIMSDVYASRHARESGDTNFVPAVTVDQPPFRNEGRQLVNADSLAWAHQHGVAILTWVVNDEADMQLLIDLGVDGIYTSYPDRLLRLLGRT